MLATELHAPRRRSEVVRRDRFRDRIDTTRPPGLTLVSAPAGFGKTTLLTEWIGEDDRATAWLSVDARDSDPALFSSYVVAALQTVDPGIVPDRTGLDPSGSGPSSSFRLHADVGRELPRVSSST